MGLDNLSKYTITSSRCEEDLVIKTCKTDEDISETTCKFQLSSLFTLLEDGKLREIQHSVTKITSLDLSNCDLSELPKCIKILRLKNFNISHNKFTQVPLCLYGNGLRALESLDMSYNKLGHFDIEPDCVLSLKRLKLNNNCFENVPKWFLTFRCTNLEEFSYSQNKAKHYDYLKNSFNLNFMKLRKLELENSCLLDKDISWLKCYKTLNYLDISNRCLVKDTKYINKFKELDKLFVKPKWKAMEILKMNSLDVSFFPEGLFWLESLRELHFNNNLLSWFPDGLEFLVNLEILDVSNNQLVFIPKQFAHLAKLKSLFASGNHLEEVPVIPDSLEVLDLYDNHLTVFDNKNFETVTILDLEYNYITVEDDQINSYKTYCQKRDIFRDSYHIKDRCIGAKIRKELDSSSESGRNYDSDEDLVLGNIETCYNNIIDQERITTPVEDWDKDISSSGFKHPDISLSDHEYDGEKETYFPQNFLKMSMTYIDDEDIMFVDAD